MNVKYHEISNEYDATKGLQPQGSGEYHRGGAERVRRAHSDLLSGRSQSTAAGPVRRSEIREKSKPRSIWQVLRPLTERHRDIGGSGR